MGGETVAFVALTGTRRGHSKGGGNAQLAGPVSA